MNQEVQTCPICTLHATVTQLGDRDAVQLECQRCGHPVLSSSLYTVLNRTGFHDLRHHGATMALYARFSAPIVMALGGWKTEQMIAGAIVGILAGADAAIRGGDGRDAADGGGGGERGAGSEYDRASMGQGVAPPSCRISGASVYHPLTGQHTQATMALPQPDGLHLGVDPVRIMVPVRTRGAEARAVRMGF